jgi:hypothetical protein
LSRASGLLDGLGGDPVDEGVPLNLVAAERLGFDFDGKVRREFTDAGVEGLANDEGMRLNRAPLFRGYARMFPVGVPQHVSVISIVTFVIRPLSIGSH